MNIRDVETHSGLERATIRYYEKEGLLHPVRHENGYRDYSATDVEQLLKIKLLRQLGFSLERIGELQQGSVDLKTVLEEQISILSKEAETAARKQIVCRQLQLDKASYISVNPRAYLKMLSEESVESMQHQPGPQALCDNIEPERHPLRRFFARLLDHFLLCAILDFLIFVVFRIRILPFSLISIGSGLIRYAAWWLSIPISAAFLTYNRYYTGKMDLGDSVGGCGRRGSCV